MNILKIPPEAFLVEIERENLDQLRHQAADLFDLSF